MRFASAAGISRSPVEIYGAMRDDLAARVTRLPGVERVGVRSGAPNLRRLAGAPRQRRDG